MRMEADMTSPAMTIDQMLAAARARLVRVGPEQAHQEAAAGALLVDIRPQAQRAAEGEIPGAMIVERNVLEWRFDPAPPRACRRPATTCGSSCSARRATPPAWPPPRCRTWACSRATDLDGGFQAWRRAGLPATAARSQQRELNLPLRLGRLGPARLGRPCPSGGGGGADAARGGRAGLADPVGAGQLARPGSQICSLVGLGA